MEIHRWGITGTRATSAPIVVYGQIPGAQNAAAGSYADTVTVTITF
ncbi:MAG: spore coat protein U domain-containing protein [Candidatus Acidiferrales bacterium]|jgi:spore coat protein U-like protein